MYLRQAFRIWEASSLMQHTDGTRRRWELQLHKRMYIVPASARNLFTANRNYPFRFNCFVCVTKTRDTCFWKYRHQRSAKGFFYARITRLYKKHIFLHYFIFLGLWNLQSWKRRFAKRIRSKMKESWNNPFKLISHSVFFFFFFFHVNTHYRLKHASRTSRSSLIRLMCVLNNRYAGRCKSALRDRKGFYSLCLSPVHCRRYYSQLPQLRAGRASRWLTSHHIPRYIPHRRSIWTHRRAGRRPNTASADRGSLSPLSLRPSLAARRYGAILVTVTYRYR